MSSFVGLLKREWYEHKGAFIWAPGVILILILLTGLMTTTVDGQVDMELSVEERAELGEQLDERIDLSSAEDLSFLEAAAAMAFDAAGSTDAELQQKTATLLWAVAIPFQVVLVFVAFFALIASLYDERRDQSVLFWKSMPVSDLQTVVSKLVFVLWLAPLVTVAMIIFAQFFAITLSSIFVESGMGGRIWAASLIWWRPFELLIGFLVLGVWALPLAAWVMLVSAYVSRSPILWAIGVPGLAVIVEKIFIGTNVVGQALGEHIKTLFASPVSQHASLLDQLASLLQMRVWGGVLVAIVLFYGVHWCRRHINEA